MRNVGFTPEAVLNFETDLSCRTEYVPDFIPGKNRYGTYPVYRG